MGKKMEELKNAKMIMFIEDVLIVDGEPKLNISVRKVKDIGEDKITVYGYGEDITYNRVISFWNNEGNKYYSKYDKSTAIETILNNRI